MIFSKTALEVTELVGGKLVGCATVKISSVASLADAQVEQLTFLGNDKYKSQIATTNAGIILLPLEFAGTPKDGQAWICCANPSASFAEIVELFAQPAPSYPSGIHPSAVISEGVLVAESAYIGACAVIEQGAKIAENSIIGAGCFIGEYAEVGVDCHIYPNVTIRERSIIGNRVIIHSGTTIGSDGFGFIPGVNGHTKILQVGIVVIEDDVELGAQCAVDRARFGKTLIKQGTKIDNLVQIAHNVTVGEHCFIVAQAGVAGSSTIGRGVILAGQVGVAGHLTVGDGVIIAGQSGVTKDVSGSGKSFCGMPAIPQREYVRQNLHIHQIPKLKKSIKALQKELEEIKGKLENS